MVRQILVAGREILVGRGSWGIVLEDGERSVAWRLVVDAETGGHCWISVTLTRGRWREVRRTLEAVGHTVRRLIRIRLGPLRLDEGLPRGGVRPLSSQERHRLLATGKRGKDLTP